MEIPGEERYTNKSKDIVGTDTSALDESEEWKRLCHETTKYEGTISRWRWQR